MRGRGFDRIAFLAKQGVSEEDYQASLQTLPYKVQAAIEGIQNSPFDPKSTYVGHSGGKDSVLVHYLARQAGEFDVVHTPKVSGPNAVSEETRLFLYQLPYVIRYVPAHLHQTLGYRTQIDGTRIAEHARENGRSTTFVHNGVDRPRTELKMYVENGLFGLNFIYPIYDWTDADVWACILEFDIPFSSEYL